MLRLVRTEDVAEAPAYSIAREFTDPYLELVRLLREACEIEHSLMLQYLYAAFSVKAEYQGKVAGVAGNRSDGLLGVAVQEMLHLRSVNRMLTRLGAEPHLGRQGFPYDPLIYPFPMALERLTAGSLAKYIYAEAPADALHPERQREAGDREFAERVLALLPEGARMNHVGTLYKTVLGLLDELPAGARPAGLEEMRAEIVEIREQGEEDHYLFFKRLFLDYDWSDPGSVGYPSQAVATNPSAMRGQEGVIADAGLLAKARLANLHYWIVLALLEEGYRLGGESREAAKYAHHAVRHMMEALFPLGMELAEAGSGIPFDLLGQSGPGLTRAMRLLEEARGAAASEERSLAVIEESLADLGAGEGKRVAVIGSGPAGLAAAVALARGGYRVEIFERSDVAAGKVYSYRDGEKRSIEHGVHGWWMNYLNFNAILELAGVDLEASLKTAEGSSLALRDGRVFALRNLPGAIPSPLHLLVQTLRAPYLRWTDTLGMIRFAIHLLAFEHERDYGRYDGESFQALMNRTGVPERVQKFILEPFILSFDFTTADRVSAACGLSGIQFYVLHDQDSILARWSRGLPAEKIFGPLVRYVEGCGGRLRLRAGVEGLARTKAGWTVRARAEQGAGEGEIGRVAAGACGEGTYVKAGDGWVGRSGGRLVALDGRCTHQGCPVEWEAGAGRFACPCHGGKFDRTGRALEGPPEAPLGALEVREEGGDAVVYGQAKVVEYRFDAVVVATDLEGAKRLLGETAGCSAALRENLSKLDTTPVIVVRMWFPRGTELPGGMESALTPDAAFTDNLFCLNAFDGGYDAEGLVVEAQSYRVFEWLEKSDGEILERTLEDLRAFCPGLRGVPPAHFTVHRHRALFTRYAPGLAALRPGAGTGMEALWLAGDWTEAEHSVWMMERAVVSGLRAANAVMGKGTFPVRRLGEEGWLLRLSRKGAELARRVFFD